ncbi:ABC transporter permease [Microbacterium pseudoresistens]|uniref:Autoinducer 2 import system permease protein LsrC n=1 Tax=Microbacterium pseudoresistens TaxID=640634 RepID=A0A7Y9JMU6_9MICO|nr:ABC transporter permease [Microbacterium pseudoresistens]NYD54730.1 rhamnose transport system permease protein [Microbacterium pseudoresistens]
MSVPTRTEGRPAWQRFAARTLTSREAAVAIVLVLLILVATIQRPSFLFGQDGIRDLLLTPSILVLLAVAQAVVLITRNIDLSVASTLGLSAWLAGTVASNMPGVPLPFVALAALGMGALLGSVNAVLIAVVGAPALVVTLGTLYAFRGINVMWAGGKTISASDMPADFRSFGVSSVFGVPTLSVIALVLVFVVAWYMRYRQSARELYAIGSDPAAALMLGLPSKRLVFLAFVASGAIAGLAGFLYAARYGAVDSQAGSGLELSAVAAAVLGGVAIFGGSGTVWGAAIGAVLLITINRTLPLLGVPQFWQQAVVGALIIGAIILDRLLSLQRARRLSAIREKEND